MTKSTYTTATKDSSNYEAGYKVFLQRSDFREKIIEQFSNLASTMIKEKQSLRVLDLGCGNGVMTQKYINELKKIASDIDVSLLEPAHDSLEDAIQLLKAHVQTVNPISNLSANTSFDLIIASYVFYHLSPESLDQILNQLGPSGSLVIMMGTNNHPLKSHPKLKLVSNHGSSDKLKPFIDDLLKSNKFKVSRHEVDTKLRLNGLWPNRAFTQEAQKLLSFSLNKNFDELTETSIEALNEIFETAFTSGDESLKSVHEIIWIERT